MVFKLSPNVILERDPEHHVRQLIHLQEPYMGNEITRNDPRALSAAYLEDVAEIYSIPLEMLEGIGKLPSEQLESTDTELRFGEEKRILDTVSVSFSQTYYGLPIWESGLNVSVQDNPLRVTSSYSTLHYEVNVELLDKNALEIERLDEERLGQVMGIQKKAYRNLKLNKKRLRIYKYSSDDRFHIENRIVNESVGRSSAPPILPLPPVSQDITEGIHYVIIEALFTLPVKGWGSVNWRAFIEPSTSSVLYLRASVACVGGSVFVNDPKSRSNDATVVATATSTVLNPWRQGVVLPGLTAPSSGSNQELTGEYVRLSNVLSPDVPFPTEAAGTDFSYDARSENFSAVNAYYHCDGLFRLMRNMGFTITGSTGYFDGTVFPVKVDPLATIDGDSVNAECHGDVDNDGVEHFAFGRCVSGTTVGMSTEFQTAAHEFGHALLHDSVHSANFGFCHSAGDSLAVILADPYSQYSDRFLTFPWCPITGAGERRHNRSVSAGWAWGGTQDNRSYGSEQILSTTLFRVYQSTGGDSTHPVSSVRLATKEQAARYMAYLIFKSIGLLATTPMTATPNASVYATKLMNADTGTMSFDGFPGGTHQKIIRWSFEKQGLYQPTTSSTPVSSAGSPPAVDVYIDDGRSGEYAPYLENFWETTDIWNILSANPTTVPTDHTTPVLDAPNYCYVKVRNRGTETANNVVVEGYHNRPSTMLMWPGDWEPMTTPRLPAVGSASISIAPGGTVTIGPFEWTPRVRGHECLLMIASADGDRSNSDAATMFPCALGPTPHWRLVPFDNNIAQRNVAPVAGGGRSKGLMGSFKNRSFWIDNPTEMNIRVKIEVMLPEFLKKLGWRLYFPGVPKNSLTLKPTEKREVQLRLKKGRDFLLENEQDQLIIRVRTISDGIVTGGMSYMLDPRLETSAPELTGKAFKPRLKQK